MPVTAFEFTQGSYLTLQFGEDDGTGNTTRPVAYTQSDAARALFTGHLSTIGVESFEAFADDTPAPIAITNFGGLGFDVTFDSDPAGGTSPFVNKVTNPTGTNGAGRFPYDGENYLDVRSVPSTKADTVGQSTLKISFSSAVKAFGGYATDIGEFVTNKGFPDILSVEIRYSDTTIETVEFPNLLTGTGGTPANGSLCWFGIISTKSFDRLRFYTPSTDVDDSGFSVWGFDYFTASIELLPPTSGIPGPPLICQNPFAVEPCAQGCEIDVPVVAPVVYTGTSAFAVTTGLSAASCGNAFSQDVPVQTYGFAPEIVPPVVYAGLSAFVVAAGLLAASCGNAFAQDVPVQTYDFVSATVDPIVYPAPSFVTSQGSLASMILLDLPFGRGSFPEGSLASRQDKIEMAMKWRQQDPGFGLPDGVVLSMTCGHPIVNQLCAQEEC